MPEKFKRGFSLLALFWALGMFLLGPASLPSPSISVNQEKELPRGEIVDKVVCKADSSQTYALFLPSNYTAEKKWPIMYAFDPGARGKIPVALFRGAAQKYGYIVAGSNNSRNGEPPAEAIKALLVDTGSRFSIDQQRVYTTGFSGGARVACTVAQMLKGSVAGVIACSGGFPPGLNPSKSTPFILFGTAGSDDFNFPEMNNSTDRWTL